MSEAGGTSVKSRAGVKHTVVTDALRQAIVSGAYPVGAKLPSVADLARTYGISPATAHRSIRDLAAERLVVCHSSPRGTVVARREAPARTFQRTTLACLLRPFRPERTTTDNFGLDIIQGIQDESGRRRYRLLLHCLADERHPQDVLALAQEGWVAGAILDQYTPLDFMRRLGQAGAPIVVFNRLESVEGLSCVTADYERLGRQTARLMLERGYERFAFFPAKNGGEVWTERIWPAKARYTGYMSELEGAGVAPDRIERIVLPEEVAYGGCEPAHLGLPRRRPAGWPRLGVFLRSDNHIHSFMSVVAKTNLELAKDIGVVGFGDLDTNRLRERPVSTWDADPRGIGREAAAEAIRRIEAPQEPRSIIKLAASFVERETL